MPVWFPRTLTDAVQFVPLRILFLVVIALVARAVVNGLIDRAVRRSTGDRRRLRIKALEVLRETDRERDSGRRDSRIRALGSLARSATSVLITLVTLLMLFSEMGFNITSIIAGTSIVAVTVGRPMSVKPVLLGLRTTAVPGSSEPVTDLQASLLAMGSIAAPVSGLPPAEVTVVVSPGGPPKRTAPGWISGHVAAV